MDRLELQAIVACSLSLGVNVNSEPSSKQYRLVGQLGPLRAAMSEGLGYLGGEKNVSIWIPVDSSGGKASGAYGIPNSMH